MNILRRRVLVLNKDWMALGTCTVRRAITLISNFDENGVTKAKGIAEDLNIYEWEDWIKLNPGELFVRSVYRKVKVPEVIICRTKTLPRMHASFTRAGVFRRDNYTCQYCDKYISGDNLTIDHVIPRCRGGKHDWYNCVASCVKCNNYKGNRTPEESKMKLAKEPTKPPLIMCEGPIPEIWQKFIKN